MNLFHYHVRVLEKSDTDRNFIDTLLHKYKLITLEYKLHNFSSIFNE